MKRAMIAAIAVFVLAAAAPAANAIGIFGMWWSPKDIESGYGVGITHSISIIPIVHVDARASWANFSEGNADIDVFPLEAMGALSFGLIYAGFGVGYYITSGDPDLDNTFGAFLVGGAKFTPGGFGVFGEVKYNFVRPNYGSSNGEFNMDGIGINVGVSLGG